MNAFWNLWLLCLICLHSNVFHKAQNVSPFLLSKLNTVEMILSNFRLKINHLRGGTYLQSCPLWQTLAHSVQQQRDSSRPHVRHSKISWNTKLWTKQVNTLTNMTSDKIICALTYSNRWQWWRRCLDESRMDSYKELHWMIFFYEVFSKQARKQMQHLRGTVCLACKPLPHDHFYWFFLLVFGACMPLMSMKSFLST